MRQQGEQGCIVPYLAWVQKNSKKKSCLKWCFAFEEIKSEINEVDRSGSNRARVFGLNRFAKSNNLKEVQSCPWCKYRKLCGE
jgi:hypothetical protein